MSTEKIFPGVFAEHVAVTKAHSEEREKREVGQERRAGRDTHTHTQTEQSKRETDR
jgi:hypothetical protein